MTVQSTRYELSRDPLFDSGYPNAAIPPGRERAKPWDILPCGYENPWSL